MYSGTAVLEKCGKARNTKDIAGKLSEKNLLCVGIAVAPMNIPKVMFQLIKTHKWAVLFAFLAGALVAFPQFYFPYDHAEDYQGIYIANTDSEGCYLVNIREVQDGRPGLGSAVFKDWKDDPFFKPPGPEILTGYLGKMFFLDFNNTILLSRFLLSLLAFLAIYTFVFLMTKERLVGFVAASLVLLAKSIIGRGAFLALIADGAPSAHFLDPYRPVHPQVDFPIFFGFLLFFWLFWEKRKIIWGVVSALILGLSFYFYPYIWSFLYAFLGVLFLILLFQKRWQGLKRIFLVASGGILISIPYFITVYKSSLYPYFEDVLFRARYVETRGLIFGILVPSLFLIFLIFFPKKPRERFIFCLSLLTAPFIVLNQQVVTGRVFSPGHYHWYFNQPLAIIFLTIIFFSLIPRSREIFKKISAFFLIGFSIYVGVVIQSASYKESEAKILSYQRYGPINQWLEANASKDEVVFTDLRYAEILPIYTSLNVFYSDCAPMFFSASRERALNALFLFYRLDGGSYEDAKTLFLQKDERDVISIFVYSQYYGNVS